MKVYFLEATHKKTGGKLYKFGMTSDKDILDRFKPSKFTSNAKWSEFYLRPLWSAYCSLEEANDFEREMQRRYPKNIILENYLNESYGHFDGLSGITETFVCADYERNQILKELFRRKDKDQRLK